MPAIIANRHMKTKTTFGRNVTKRLMSKTITSNRKYWNNLFNIWHSRWMKITVSMGKVPTRLYQITGCWWYSCTSMNNDWLFANTLLCKKYKCKQASKNIFVRKILEREALVNFYKLKRTWLTYRVYSLQRWKTRAPMSSLPYYFEIFVISDNAFCFLF